MNRKKFADSLGFLTLEGQPPVADANLGVDVIHVTSYWPLLREWNKILEYHKNFVQTLLTQQSTLRLVLNSQELELALKDEVTAVVVGSQNPPDDIVGVGQMYDAGVRFSTIAYNKCNRNGNGYYYMYNGLTEEGREFLRECARVGMILDFSHSSHQTARDAARFIKEQCLEMKVIATHTGVYDLYNNPRSLPTDVLDFIVESGGLVGIPLFMFFLSPTDDTIAPFIAHLDWVIRRYGAECVCVGTDTPYVSASEDVLRAHFRQLAGHLDPEEVTKPRFPQQPLDLYSPRKMQILREMLSGSFSDSVLDKVMGENFIEYLKCNL